mmetsp:Transcript_85306/g.246270  ORF Transcript_85306/g.246270 Transcript_85306/m.246270 type:complete len:239 (+) Transcript_85306:1673-2389(+)
MCIGNLANLRAAKARQHVADGGAMELRDEFAGRRRRLEVDEGISHIALAPEVDGQIQEIVRIVIALLQPVDQHVTSIAIRDVAEHHGGARRAVHLRSVGHALHVGHHHGVHGRGVARHGRGHIHLGRRPEGLRLLFLDTPLLRLRCLLLCPARTRRATIVVMLFLRTVAHRDLHAGVVQRRRLLQGPQVAQQLFAIVIGTLVPGRDFRQILDLLLMVRLFSQCLLAFPLFHPLLHGLS